MNTIIAPGLSSYALQRGAFYRVTVDVRSTIQAPPANEAQVALALDTWGLKNGVIYEGVPADWPDESGLPPLSADEKRYHFAGYWENTIELPTAFQIAATNVVVVGVWRYDSDAMPVGLDTSGQDGSTTSSGGGMARLVAGLVLLAFGVGAGIYASRRL